MHHERVYMLAVTTDSSYGHVSIGSYKGICTFDDDEVFYLIHVDRIDRSTDRGEGLRLHAHMLKLDIIRYYSLIRTFFHFLF